LEQQLILHFEIFVGLLACGETEMWCRLQMACRAEALDELEQQRCDTNLLVCLCSETGCMVSVADGMSS
jgi:hypothetical protein